MLCDHSSNRPTRWAATDAVSLTGSCATSCPRYRLGNRKSYGQIARKGTKAPVQATQRWHIARTHARQNAFHRLARCCERRITVIEAFFDLADTITTFGA